MTYRRVLGRPTKLNIRTLLKLTDALRNNYNVTDSCKWAGISTNTYYRHLNNDMVFTARVNHAIESRNEVSFNFDIVL